MQFHRKTQRKPGGGHTFSWKIYPKAHQKYPQAVKKDGKHSLKNILYLVQTDAKLLANNFQYC